MPEAPEQFRVGLTLGNLDWTEKAPLNAVEDGAVWGLEVETLVHPFLGFRFGVGRSRPEVRSGLDRASVDQYLVELLAGLRFPVGPLRRLELVPFLTGGYGSVVHAPDDRDDLITKNQSSYLLGGGVEYNGLPEVGVRGEWRRARIEFNDLFDPEDRGAAMREADRWILGVYWRF